MRILVLRSAARVPGAKPTDPYTQEFAGTFAEKVVGNLLGERGFCTACGPDCTACRDGCDRRFAGSIAGVIELPAVLPYLLEDPARHVPSDVPGHEIVLAVRIHEQILLEFLKRCSRWGTRGVVVPIESPDWLSPAARRQAREICRGAGVEIALPRPFCDFDPPAGGVLADFRRRFHVGRPAVELTVRDGRIEKAHVAVSAACGATYYVARWLTGKRVEDDLKYEVVAKRMHSYPCTASMKWDDEVSDTLMHVASRAHYEILDPLNLPDPLAGRMVPSPVGRMVLEPTPPRENIRNIERAKEAILERLAAGRTISLKSLRKERRITPAAFSSALLILTQAGIIRTDRGKIVKA